MKIAAAASRRAVEQQRAGGSHEHDAAKRKLDFDSIGKPNKEPTSPKKKPVRTKTAAEIDTL